MLASTYYAAMRARWGGKHAAMRALGVRFPPRYCLPLYGARMTGEQKASADALLDEYGDHYGRLGARHG